MKYYILLILFWGIINSAYAQTTPTEPTTRDVDKIQVPPPPPPPPSPEPAVVEIFKYQRQHYHIRFPGCENEMGSDSVKYECSERKMYEFFYKNLQYPIEAKRAGITGIVKASFVVDKDGSTIRPTIIKGVGYGCDEEVIRLINLMTTKGVKWTCGKSRGYPVRLLKEIEIVFELE